MPSDQDIIKWMRNIERQQPSSRKRECSNGLVSPPRSAMSTTSRSLKGSPHKKRKLDKSIDEDLDQISEEMLDLTPRAGRPWEPRPTTSSSVSSSGASSPRKHMLSLAIRPQAIFRKVLEPNAKGISKSLLNMLSTMEEVSQGIGVIASAEQESLDNAALSSDWLGPKFRSFVYDDEGRAKLGHTPTVEHVQEIVAEAAWCIETDQVEAGWNSAVHYPLLKLAMHKNVRQRRQQLIDFSPCTTASILSGYQSAYTPRKMVDFVIVVRPDRNPASEADSANMRARMNSLRSTCLASSINHTGLSALLDTPIAVSIETKRPVADKADHAELQMSTWLAAHWRKLENLVKLSRPGDDVDRRLAELHFLPGVIVQGHEWRFVAGTREGDNTTFWVDKCFGSTESVLGVYKIVFGLQILAQWAREVFDPWFRHNILS